MDMNFALVPFGKYKGRLAFEIASDYAYVAWLLCNPRVTAKHQWLRDIAIDIARHPDFIERLIAQTTEHMKKAAAVSP